MVDAVENFKPYFPVLGHPKTPLVSFTAGVKADYLLFTHLHLDHFDTSVIEKCLKPGGKIIVYRPLADAVANLGRECICLDYDESFTDQGITFRSVYSLDGIGEEQTAWLISCSGTTIFHGGDTIWHNQFWRLGKKYPGIDYAFLPVNAAVVDFRMVGLAYSTVPVSMTPEEAFNAAKLLQAKCLVPIHYGLFETPNYRPGEVTDELLETLSLKIAQPFRVLKDGEYLLEKTTS